MVCSCSWCDVVMIVVCVARVRVMCVIARGLVGIVRVVDCACSWCVLFMFVLCCVIDRGLSRPHPCCKVSLFVLRCLFAVWFVLVRDVLCYCPRCVCSCSFCVLLLSASWPDMCGVL